MKFKRSLSGLFVLGAIALSLQACSSAKKKTTPVLSDMNGKKVALISVDGEETPKKIVEVALVNQLVQRGTFILVPKPDVEAARAAPEQDPTDWKGIAKRAGADFALQAKVLKFDAPVREGYSSEEVVDSQLAEEMGTDGKTQQVFKTKSMEGDVQVELQFTRLEDGDTRSGVAEAREKVEANAKSSSIRMPPPLRFLEKLSNKAFREFFDRYN
jgi:hypothetical protein